MLSASSDESRRSVPESVCSTGARRPARMASTITNGQKLVLMFRLPKLFFSDVDFGQKRQLARKQPSLAKTVAGTKNGTVSRGEKARIQSLLPPRTETLEGRNQCARAARIYIRTGEKSVRTRRLDRSGSGGLQVAPTKGVDPNLPRGFCRSASTRVRPIAGGRIANVVNKFRSALLSFSVTAGRREIQRESPPNLTNGQEAGKTFQRKMFHVLTVFFASLGVSCSTPSLGQLVLAPALRSEVAALIL